RLIPTASRTVASRAETRVRMQPPSIFRPRVIVLRSPARQGAAARGDIIDTVGRAADLIDHAGARYGLSRWARLVRHGQSPPRLRLWHSGLTACRPGDRVHG